MLVAYINPEPLTLAEVKLHARIDATDDDTAIETGIIPAARAMAEAKTGCAIRTARYTDTITLPGSLAVGGVIAIESVKVDGVTVTYTSAEVARRTVITSVENETKTAVVTYTAGIDIAKHPGARAWMLLACAWLYADREMVRDGNKTEMPRYITDTLLMSIDVPTAI